MAELAGERFLTVPGATDWLADAFGFKVLSPEGFEAGAKYLLKRG